MDGDELGEPNISTDAFKVKRGPHEHHSNWLFEVATTQGKVSYMYLEFSAAQVKICNIKTIRTRLRNYW